MLINLLNNMDVSIDNSVIDSAVLHENENVNTEQDEVIVESEYLFLPPFKVEDNSTSDYEIAEDLQSALIMEKDPLLLEANKNKSDGDNCNKLSVVELEHKEVNVDAETSSYFCNNAEEIFKSKQENKKHIERRNMKNFKCTICKISFCNEIKLKLHINSNLHKNNNNINCRVKECINNINDDDDEFDGNEKFKCNYCGKTFRFKSKLTAHVNVHTQEKRFVCNICNKTFHRVSCLKRHINMHTDEKRFTCNYCGKSFHFRFHLTSHMNVHINNKRFTCGSCKTSFFSKSDLMHHISVHPNEKRSFRCNLCEKTFNTNSSLSIHLNTHINEHRFSCTFCDKSFNHKGNLIRHVKFHTDAEKKFVCTFCEKCFSQKCDLTRHVNIHTNEKKYACTFCKKSYSQNSDLVRHLRIHTDGCRFICNFCGKLFNDKRYLKTHVNTHTKERQFTCNICNKSYYQSSSLFHHIKNKHKNQNNELSTSICKTAHDVSLSPTYENNVVHNINFNTDSSYERNRFHYVVCKSEPKAYENEDVCDDVVDNNNDTISETSTNESKINNNSVCDLSFLTYKSSIVNNEFINLEPPT
ncbi:uncharacterized protein LOC142333933 [Lycorma delicatula]|uniref:uncharacterized protein LOC142333933 n=1 Tax=Lycorma delicatula TaxID=130591 RepID=UPI003F512985